MKILSKRVYLDDEGGYRLRSVDVAVSSVLGCFDAGRSKEEVRAKYSGLTYDDIDVCRVLAAMFMPERHEYKRNKKSKISLDSSGHPPVNFVFDENLSWKIIPEIVNRISEVSHIALEGMNGAKDIEIWQRFKTNGARSVIVTNDDDFIKLAQVFSMHAMMAARRMGDIDDELKANPFVVRVGLDHGESNKSTGRKATSVQFLKGAFKKYSHRFVKEAMRDMQRTAYMELGAKGLFRQTYLPEVFARYVNQRWLEPSGGQMSDELLANMDFEHAINWKRLNDVRKSVDLASVSPADYR